MKSASAGEEAARARIMESLFLLRERELFGIGLYVGLDGGHRHPLSGRLLPTPEEDERQEDGKRRPAFRAATTLSCGMSAPGISAGWRPVPKANRREHP